MKLISSNNNKRDAIALTTDERTAIVREVRGIFGNERQMLAFWDVAKYNERNGKHPATSMARILVSYGKADVRYILRQHLRAAFFKMGETKMTSETITSVAEAMADTMEIETRVLDFGRLLGFFGAITRGEYNLYNCTHLQVMNAFRDYCKKAFAEQTREGAARDREEQEKADAKHRAESVTWEQYKQMRGIEDENPLNAI